jgi:hypothetical protein
VFTLAKAFAVPATVITLAAAVELGGGGGGGAHPEFQLLETVTRTIREITTVLQSFRQVFVPHFFQSLSDFDFPPAYMPSAAQNKTEHFFIMYRTQ